ncbi:uncharacterized protein [Asterias amurensis]|uniref:uncharacterized protein n=1 Tax=Asterias amurensis TaxID=7602 RepID=UPI003AB832CE
MLYPKMFRCSLLIITVSLVILAPNLCGVLAPKDGEPATDEGGRIAVRDGRSVQRLEESSYKKGAKVSDDVLQCGRNESCRNRCGSPANESESYLCFCDELCTSYQDCCMDFHELCRGRFDDKMYIASQLEKGDKDQLETETETLAFRFHFECKELAEFRGGSIWMKSTCAPSWSDLRMSKLCNNVHSGDTVARLPVQGNDGFTYRNLYCAQCNYAIVNVTYWIGVSACYSDPPPDASTNMASLASYLQTSCRTLVDEPRLREVSKPRFCLRNVDWCDYKYAPQIGADFVPLVFKCQNKYQGLVRGRNASGASEFYKNPFCALCNGIQSDRISCDVPALTRYSNSDYVHYYDFFSEADTVSAKLYEEVIPKFVVVTNLNIRNNSSVMILETGTNSLLPVDIHCGDTQVYDPYTGECRNTYCAANYALSDNQCVLKKPYEPDFHYNVTSPTTFFSSVEVTFSITVNIMWFVNNTDYIENPNALNPYNDTDFNFTEFHEKIKVRGFEIGQKNITLNLSEIIEFIGSLDPNEQNGTLDDAAKFWLSLLSFEINALQVNVGGHVFNIDSCDVEKFIYSIKGNLGALSTFLWSCPTGVKNVYNTDQIIINSTQNGDECNDMQLKQTNVSYECADWLLLSYHDSARSEQYTSVVVCESDPTALDPSCLRIQYEQSEYVFENDTVILNVNGMMYKVGEYEKSGDGRVFVCNDFDTVIETKYIVHLNFTTAQNIIAVVGVGISTTCLVATLFTYAMFEELRTLPGLNLMTLAVVLLINDWTFLFGLYATDNRTACRAVAVFLHFICLCQLFWVNVIAYDVYKTFGRKRLIAVNANQSHRKQYLRYALYAWGMPIIIVGMSVFFDFCDCTYLDVDYGVYGSCWISDPVAYAIFFGMPMFVANACNACLFIVTVCNLRRYHRKSAVISGNADTYNHFALCAKLATVMGFAWNIAFLASLLHNAILWYFFFFLYFPQGLFMFLSYTFNRRVYRMYQQKFTRKRFSSSSNSVVSPKIKSRPPSVGSQVSTTPRYPEHSTPQSCNEIDHSIEPEYINLSEPPKHTRASLHPARSVAYRQKTRSYTVSHISRQDNFDSLSLETDNSRSRLHLTSFRDGIRHLRTSSDVGAASVASSSPDLSYTSSLELRHFELGRTNDAFCTSDEYSSDEDDVFQPAFYITEC